MRYASTGLTRLRVDRWLVLDVSLMTTVKTTPDSARMYDAKHSAQSILRLASSQPIVERSQAKTALELYNHWHRVHTRIPGQRKTDRAPAQNEQSHSVYNKSRYERHFDDRRICRDAKLVEEVVRELCDMRK